MAAFRRTFLVLAVLALAATSVFAQGPFGCATTPAVNATMRSGGLTELAGEVKMVCTGISAGGNVTANIQVQVPGTQITNRIISTGPSGSAISAALQVQDMSGNPVQVVQGLLQAGGGLVIFPNVVIPATPTGTTATIRITNIRVAAPTVTDANVVTPIFETISSVPFQAVPITNPSQQVGTVYQALTFSVTDCAGGTAPSLTFQQCIDQPTGGAGALSFGVKFSERNFGGAFKTKAQENGVSVPGAASDVPPVVTDTADTGTRLIVTFTNVPAGVDINVTTRELDSSFGARATLVPNADSTGDGGTISATGSTDATCGVDKSGTGIPALDSQGATAVLHSAATSGSTVYAVWEITSRPIGVAGAAPIASVVFGVQVSFTANPGAGSPALTGSNPGSVTGNFAPLSTVAVADDTSPIPRFATAPVSGPPIFAIVPCVTNLLFPYVTSTQGFDTGFALTNTSADGSDNNGVPFNTSSQTGPCHLYFFGNMTIAPQDTDSVDPGTLIKFTLNAPPSTFQASTAGFEGYVIARCDFQYAHGLAFIVDTRVPGFGSQAYLALVIPDRTDGSRPPSPFTTAQSGSGEQLAQ
jgi:hypothetical protein